MATPKTTSLNSVQSLFYKFCFCLGLGTASVSVYGQIVKWVNPASESPVAHHGQGLQHKLNQIAQAQAGGVIPAFARTVDAVPVQAFLAPGAAPVVAAPIDPNAPVTVTSESALAAASPSPSVSPDASPTDPNAQAAASPTPAEDPNNPQAPIAPVAQQPMDAYGNAPMAFQAPVAPDANVDRSISSDSKVPASAMAAPSDLAMSGSAPLKSAAETAAASATTYPISTTPVSSSRSTTKASNTLTSQDLQWLAGSANGTFTSSMINGLGVSSAGGPAAQVSVSSLSWDKTTVLSPNATLTLRNGNTGVVNADITLSLQTPSGLTPVSFSTVSRIAAQASTGTNGNRTIQVYFADQTILGQYPLSNLQATLVFDSSGHLVNTASTLSFTRTEVVALAGSWDPSTSATAPTYTVENVAYSMNLQK